MRAALARAGEKSVRVVLDTLEGKDPVERLKAALAILRLLKPDKAGVRLQAAAQFNEREDRLAPFSAPDYREAAAIL